MLERLLELNLRLRALARRYLAEGDRELLEEFSELLEEVYEEMGAPRPDVWDLMREPRLGLKVILTNLSEDLADLLYRSIGSEYETSSS
ncbi:MAG: hypothetical protein QXJ48_03480 [Candidatus Korarchaeum sp.]